MSLVSLNATLGLQIKDNNYGNHLKTIALSKQFCISILYKMTYLWVTLFTFFVQTLPRLQYLYQLHKMTCLYVTLLTYIAQLLPWQHVIT